MSLALIYRPLVALLLRLALEFMEVNEALRDLVYFFSSSISFVLSNSSLLVTCFFNSLNSDYAVKSSLCVCSEISFRARLMRSRYWSLINSLFRRDCDEPFELFEETPRALPLSNLDLKLLVSSVRCGY